MRVILLSAILSIANTALIGQSVQWAWSESGNTGEDNVATECCVDHDGNVFVAGYYYYGDITIGTDVLPNAGIEDIFLAKYSSSGVPLWGRRIGGSDVEFCYALRCDAHGSVYLSGSFRSAVLNVDTAQLVNTQTGTQDGFLAKFDAQGELQLAMSFGGTDADLATGLALGPDDALYLSGGYYSNDFTIAGVPLPAPTNADWYLARLDTLGAVDWVRNFGDDLNELGTNLAVSDAGDVYFTGSSYSDSIVFDAYTVYSSAAGAAEGFVLRLDPDGAVIWADHFGGTGNDYAQNIALDGAGNVYLAGEFTSSTMQIGSFSLTNPGSTAIFWSKWDPFGTTLYAHKAGGLHDCRLGDFRVRPNGQLLLGGEYEESTLSINGHTISNMAFSMGGTSDLYIAHADADGLVDWLKGASQCDGDDGVRGVEMDSDTTGYAVGYFHSTWINFDGSAENTSDPNRDEFFAARYAVTPMMDGIAPQPLPLGALFPNPAHDRITVLGVSDVRAVVLMDAMGRRLMMDHVQALSGSLVVELVGVPGGVYQLLVTTATCQRTARVVVQ